MVGSSSATATHPGSLRNAPRLLSQLLSTIVAAFCAMDAFTFFHSPDSGDVAVVLSLQLTHLVCSTRRNDASFGPCVIRRPKRQLAGCSSLVQTEPRARADREEPRASVRCSGGCRALRAHRRTQNRETIVRTRTTEQRRTASSQCALPNLGS